MARRGACLVALVVLVGASVGCGDDDDGAERPPPPKPRSAKVLKDALLVREDLPMGAWRRVSDLGLAGRGAPVTAVLDANRRCVERALTLEPVARAHTALLQRGGAASLDERLYSVEGGAQRVVAAAAGEARRCRKRIEAGGKPVATARDAQDALRGLREAPAAPRPPSAAHFLGYTSEDHSAYAETLIVAERDVVMVMTVLTGATAPDASDSVYGFARLALERLRKHPAKRG